MSGDWVWVKTGGNSWYVRRAEPLRVIQLSPWWSLNPGQQLPPQWSAQRTSCPLAQAIANQNVWAYLGGMDGKP